MGNKFTLVTLGKYIEDASVSAMNRAAQTAVTRTSSFIREKYNFKKSELDEHIRIQTKATKDSTFVVVRIKKQEIGLIHFGAKQFGRPGRPKVYTKSGRLKKNAGPKMNTGVKAEVQKGNRQLFRSSDNMRASFIQTMNGGTQVFIRTSELNSEGKQKIRKLSAMGITQLFETQSGKSRATDLLQDTFNEEYQKRLDHEINRRFR
jgi:cold shock CspA family protein